MIHGRGHDWKIFWRGIESKMGRTKSTLSEISLYLPHLNGMKSKNSFLLLFTETFIERSTNSWSFLLLTLFLCPTLQIFIFYQRISTRKDSREQHCRDHGDGSGRSQVCLSRGVHSRIEESRGGRRRGKRRQAEAVDRSVEKGSRLGVRCFQCIIEEKNDYLCLLDWSEKMNLRGERGFDGRLECWSSLVRRQTISKIQKFWMREIDPFVRESLMSFWTFAIGVSPRRYR